MGELAIQKVREVHGKEKHAQAKGQPTVHCILPHPFVDPAGTQGH
jgi:hypothetical protein